MLNALEQAGVSPGRRPILTHCQILGDDLIARMQRQGVIGNIQPSFAITDASFARKRLPAHVLSRSYCWKTMLDNGVVCAGGSDAPIETCNPFQGIYDAIFRAKPSDPDSVFLPEQRLSFPEALALYTRNGAYAAMSEQSLGSLAVGFKADFVVLQHDVSVDPSKLLEPNLVQSTWVNGKKTFEASGAAENNSIEGGGGAPLDPSGTQMPGKNGRIRICRCCAI